MPRPLFNRACVNGIRDAHGKLPLKTTQALQMCANAVRIMESALKHGAHVIVEHPIGRGEGSQFAIAGRELHSTVWDVTVMREFAAKYNLQDVVFDQCRTGADTQKTTQLKCSEGVHEAVSSRIAHLMCDHEFGTHASILGKRATGTDHGHFVTKRTERFSAALNRSLAEAFLDPSPGHAKDWLASVGALLEPR